MIEIVHIHIGVFSFSAFLLFVWFETNAAIEYSKIFKLDRLFYIKEYEESLEVVPDLSYAYFLAAHEDNFTNRLLSCPYCVCTWIIFYFAVILSVTYGITALSFIFIDWFMALYLYFASSRYFSR